VGIIYTIEMFICVRIIGNRTFGILFFLGGLCAYAIYQEIYAFSFVYPLILSLVSIIYGWTRRTTSVTKQSYGQFESYDIKTPMFSTIDGTFMVSLLFIFMACGVIYVTGHNPMIMTTMGIGMIVIFLNRVPAVGSNSSASVLIILALFVFAIYSPMGHAIANGFTRVIERVVEEPKYAHTPPPYEPLSSLMSYYRSFKWYGPSQSTGTAEIVQLMLGIVFQTMMLLDDLLGPGTSIDSGVKASSKEEKKNTLGSSGNYMSIWVIGLVLQFAWLVISGSPVTMLAHLAAGAVALIAWTLLLKPVWAGNGLLAGWVKANPITEICVGDGIRGARCLMAFIISILAVLVGTGSTSSINIASRLLFAAVGTLHENLALVVLGVLTGNYAIIVTAFTNTNAIISSAKKNAVVMTTGTNSTNPLDDESPIIDDLGLDITNLLDLTDSIKPGTTCHVSKMLDDDTLSTIISWARKSKSKLYFRNEVGVPSKHLDVIYYTFDENTKETHEIVEDQ